MVHNLLSSRLMRSQVESDSLTAFSPYCHSKNKKVFLMMYKPRTKPKTPTFTRPGTSKHFLPSSQSSGETVKVWVVRLGGYSSLRHDE